MRILVASVCVFVSGCLQPADEGDGGATLALDEWCATREDLFLCDGQAGCGIADPAATCADVQSGVIGPRVGCEPALIDAVDAGRVHYDARLAAQCRQHARTTCDTSRFPWDCDGVFSGTKALGEPCALNAECGAGTWCDSTVRACPGVCAAVRAGGEPATSDIQCASGWVGEQPDGGTSCVAPPGPGAPCVGQFCGPGLSCVEGHCTSPVATGSSCDAGPCASGSICVAGTCTAWAKRGEPCASQFFPVDAGSPPCQLGLACRDGMCGDVLGAGESCRLEPNRCAGGTRCSLTTFVCERRGGLGASCTDHAQCDRLFCIDGACSPGQAEGAGCDGARSCAPGFSCDVGGVCVAHVCF